MLFYSTTIQQILQKVILGHHSNFYLNTTQQSNQRIIKHEYHWCTLKDNSDYILEKILFTFVTHVAFLNIWKIPCWIINGKSF